MQVFLTHTRSSIGKPVSNNIIYLRETCKKVLLYLSFLFAALDTSSNSLVNVILSEPILAIQFHKHFMLA